MAFTYERNDSPWMWICYLDAAGRRQRKPSDIARGQPDTKRRCKALKAEHDLQEASLPRVRREADRWENWVPKYLESRYHKKVLTWDRMKAAWAALFAYLHGSGVKTARGLTYTAASGYVDWRLGATGLRRVKHNTAIFEAKLLSVVMSEAVRKGLAAVNPCREIELHREPAKEKREITDAEQAIIEEALLKEPAWMRESWLTYMTQGCRLSEVEVPMERIDTASEERTITFKIKGRGIRLHKAPLHDDLLPLVEKARAEGRTQLVTLPCSPAKKWHDFFKRCKIEGISTHCTRVTVITRLIRNGADPVLVRQYIGHSSDEIQAIYRRLRPSDAAGLGKFLSRRAALGA